MTQQKAGYPMDIRRAARMPARDRLREMADVATDKVKNVTESAEEIAGKVAEQPASTAKRPKRPSKISSRMSTNR